MSLPAITITETKDSTTSEDYPQLPPLQDDSNLKIKSRPCLLSTQDVNKEKVVPLTIFSPESEGPQKKEEKGELGELEEDKEFDPTVGAKPYSPFYRHASPSTPIELPPFRRQDAIPAIQAQGPNVIDVELENQTRQSPENRNTDRLRFSPLSLLPRRKNQTLRSKLWAEERPKRGYLHKLNDKQRFAIKIVVAVITLGGMIGIALGITSAVGKNGWIDQASLESQG